MVTIRSGSPRVAAVPAPPAPELEDTVDGLSGDGDEPASGVEPWRAHPTVNAMMATDDPMTGEKRQCMETPFGAAHRQTGCLARVKQFPALSGDATVTPYGSGNVVTTA